MHSRIGIYFMYGVREPTRCISYKLSLEPLSVFMTAVRTSLWPGARASRSGGLVRTELLHIYNSNILIYDVYTITAKHAQSAYALSPGRIIATWEN